MYLKIQEWLLLLLIVSALIIIYIVCRTTAFAAISLLAMNSQSDSVQYSLFLPQFLLIKLYLLHFCTWRLHLRSHWKWMRCELLLWCWLYWGWPGSIYRLQRYRCKVWTDTQPLPHIPPLIMLIFVGAWYKKYRRWKQKNTKVACGRIWRVWICSLRTVKRENKKWSFKMVTQFFIEES